MIENALDLALKEVKRLRETKTLLMNKLDKTEGALNMALEHFSHMGATYQHEEFCRNKYESNAYGDDIKGDEEE